MNSERDNRILGDPGTPAFQVDRYPFYLVNRLTSRYNASLEPTLREIHLDNPRWRVLMILCERGALGVRDIADAAVIPLSTMTRIIQRMAGAELVVLSVSGDDARVTLVSLTTIGDSKLEQARVVASQLYLRVIRGLTARDADRLVDLLGRLYRNLED